MPRWITFFDDNAVRVEINSITRLHKASTITTQKFEKEELSELLGDK